MDELLSTCMIRNVLRDREGIVWGFHLNIILDINISFIHV